MKHQRQYISLKISLLILLLIINSTLLQDPSTSAPEPSTSSSSEPEPTPSELELAEDERDRRRCYESKTDKFYTCLTCQKWSKYEALRIQRNVPLYTCSTCPDNRYLANSNFVDDTPARVCCIEEDVNCSECDHYTAKCTTCREYAFFPNSDGKCVKKGKKDFTKSIIWISVCFCLGALVISIVSKWVTSNHVLKKVRRTKIIPLRMKDKKPISTSRQDLESKIHSMDEGRDIYFESGKHTAHTIQNKPKRSDEANYQAGVIRSYEFDKFRKSKGNKQKQRSAAISKIQERKKYLKFMQDQRQKNVVIDRRAQFNGQKKNENDPRLNSLQKALQSYLKNQYPKTYNSPVKKSKAKHIMNKE